MSPLNSTEHGDPHRARGILLVAWIESQLLGVISLGALAIFTSRSMTILSTSLGAALAILRRPSSVKAR